MRCYKDSMSVYKRNGKYYCRFQIDGERHHYLCNGANTKAEAEKIENGFKYKVQQRQNGVIQKKEEKNKCLLSNVLNNFLEYSKINRTVYKQDKARVKVILVFFGMQKEAEAIIRKDIDDFKSYMLDIGRSKKTINLYLDILRESYNLAIDNEWLYKNPFTQKIKFKLEPRKINYLTDDKVKRLYSCVPDEYKGIFIVALNTGLRRGNIIDLKWENIDFNFKIIEITKNKGNKHIKLPMNETVYKFLKERFILRESEYIFINPKTGKKFSTTAFERMWWKIRKKAGLDNFKFHGLRHTVGTKLAKENVPVHIIKEVLAHSDINTSMQYIHAASLDIQNAINVLNSYN